MNDIEQSIETLRKISDIETQHNYEELHKIQSFNYDLLTAIEALEEKQERANPQPLTLEELKQMDGKPIWITSCDKGHYANGVWCLVKFTDKFDELVFSAYGTVRYFKDYGTIWLAYKYKPKKNLR